MSLSFLRKSLLFSLQSESFLFSILCESFRFSFLSESYIFSLKVGVDLSDSLVMFLILLKILL